MLSVSVNPDSVSVRVAIFPSKRQDFFFKKQSSHENKTGFTKCCLLTCSLFFLYFLFIDYPHHQDLGWGPILVSLQVPELTMEEFLQECLSLGSYLTLYIYLLQCLNADQTLTNEMKILLTISKWLEQVYPRYKTQSC